MIITTSHHYERMRRKAHIDLVMLSICGISVLMNIIKKKGY